MISNLNNQKIEITYPCEWEIKIIGSDEKIMRNVTDCILEERSYTVLRSNASRTGKYLTLKIKLVLQSAEEKQDIYAKFTSDKEIKFVL